MIAFQKAPSSNISVIVPTTGTRDLTRVLEALNHQTIQPLEILVIEDLERRGCSWARNEGIKKALGKYIAFIDDDCVAPKDWIERLKNGLIQNNADIAGGTYKETDSLLSDLRKKRDLPDKLTSDGADGSLAGGNLMFTKEILEKCRINGSQYFDESFKNSQDYELIWRSKAKGANIVFVPVYPLHLKKVHFTSYLNMSFNRGRGIALLHKKISSKGSNFQAGHKSMIWRKQSSINPIKWIWVAFLKIIGPFDFKNFSSTRNFILYWLGEKVKAFGFAYQKLKR